MEREDGQQNGRAARQAGHAGRTASGRDTLGAVAPYLLWMILMTALPASAAGYAVRTFLTFVALLFLWPRMSAAATDRGARPVRETLAWGTAVGVAVCVLWVWPERFDWYRRLLVVGSGTAAPVSPYDPSVCGWPLTLWRLAGSAFVIAPAEELFFRSFLYRRLQARNWTSVRLSAFDLSAFLWTAGLFALEHDRIAAGAMAGAAYGLLAVRRGLGAAILAHAVTNLLLGLYAIRFGAWGFW